MAGGSNSRIGDNARSVSAPPALALAAGAAQGFEGFQNARQALFPRAFALEAGLQRVKALRGGGGGQQVGQGADLLGQRGGPGLGAGGAGWTGCGALRAGFKCQIGL